jgi:hypothetical protein
VNTDTVRVVLREHGKDPDRAKGLTISLIQVLKIEGVTDPETAWAFASTTERHRLLSPLQTISDYRESDVRLEKLHAGTYRRLARENWIESIRIGQQFRFRPPMSVVLTNLGGSK